MERRTFLAWATAGLGGLFGLALSLPALAYVIDPRNRKARQRDFQTVARLGDLKVNEPKQVVISDTRQDAWTLHPNEIVGRVWLVRRDDDKVNAYTTICPHLGCSINYQSQKQRFVCPCHNGTFELSGEPVPNAELGYTNPVPRAMDSLEVHVIEAKNKYDSEVQVKYQSFRQGIHDKVAKS
jgi:Rieske Fe-S protein